MLDSGILGNIYANNSGYINICMQYHDVKIVRMLKKDTDNSEFKFVTWDKKKEEIKKEICVLNKEKNDYGKIFFSGRVNLGFGIMELKIMQISEEKRKNEHSAIMFIVGRLLQEKIEYNGHVERRKEIMTSGKEVTFTEVTMTDMFDDQKGSE